MERFKTLGLPSKNSSCEVSALKKKDTDEHDVNSVLEDFRNHYSLWWGTLSKDLPKSTDKYCISTVIMNIVL